jgi:hypothetical protein
MEGRVRDVQDIALTDQDPDAAIDAMRIAAEKRVDGILVNSSLNSASPEVLSV